MGDFNIMILSNSRFLSWNCNFKYIESEFELRLILKSLVNVEIDVLNSQKTSLKCNEFEFRNEQF